MSQALGVFAALAYKLSELMLPNMDDHMSNANFPRHLWDDSAALTKWYDATGRKIERLLATTDWRKATKEKAVELFEYRCHVRHYRKFRHGKDDPRSQIPCPVEFDDLILEAAKLGMRIGEGRKRPPDSYMETLQFAIIQEIGRHRKAEPKS
jgi:hypothetical protein